MTLKTNMVIGALTCASLAMSNSFADSPGAASTFDISTTLQQAIVLTKNRDLSFPEQTTGTTATYVVMPTDPTSAQFSATGTPLTDAELSFTATSRTLNCVSGACLGPGGTNTMTVDNFTCNTINCAYSFDNDGSVTGGISLGASEHVLNTNLSGTYTGTQTISLNYK